jgi:hypothetical protein
MELNTTISRTSGNKTNTYTVCGVKGEDNFVGYRVTGMSTLKFLIASAGAVPKKAYLSSTGQGYSLTLEAKVSRIKELEEELDSLGFTTDFSGLCAEMVAVEQGAHEICKPAPKKAVELGSSLIYEEDDEDSSSDDYMEQVTADEVADELLEIVRAAMEAYDDATHDDVPEWFKHARELLPKIVE